VEGTDRTLRGFGEVGASFSKVCSPVIVILEVILTLFYNYPYKPLVKHCGKSCSSKLGRKHILEYVGSGAGKPGKVSLILSGYTRGAVM